jgi:hypothetical protein
LRQPVEEYGDARLCIAIEVLEPAIKWDAANAVDIGFNFDHDHMVAQKVLLAVASCQWRWPGDTVL